MSHIPSSSNSEPFAEASIERRVSDIVMVPKTEDKPEWMGFMWGQKALLPVSCAQRKSAHVAPTALRNFTSIECEWLEGRRSILVTYDIKSPLREKRTKEHWMKLEHGGFRLDKINTLFTV